MKFCPFAQRAHLVLEAKNIPYHTAFINLKQKPEWILQKSPLGKVPALEIPGAKGEPLIESLIIADYLDDQYPQNLLNSKDPLQRAKDRILVERFNGFIAPFYRLYYPQGNSDTWVEKIDFYWNIDDNVSLFYFSGAITDLNNALDIFEAELKTRGTKYFNGQKPGFVDYMIWPWCERTDAFPFILGAKYEMDKVRYSKLIEWKDAMKTDSAVRAIIISGENHFKFRQSTIAKPDNPDYDFLA